LEKLVTKGHEKTLSWYVIGLNPIITGRELMKDMGFTFSNSVVMYDDSFKPSRPIEFNNFPVYRAIMQSWHKIIAHPNIRNIMMQSAEIAVANKLLNDRTDPRDLVFTEPGLTPPP
jgi:hypothetical protein